VLKAFVFMNSIEASIRNTNTKGEVNTLRSKGIVPAIVYGGENQNQKVSVSKNVIKSLVDKENFLSNILTLNIEGNSQNVLPREIKFDQITDEPIHIDFLRIVKGAKITLEIPVKFINNEKSPGLKRGGVLNIVRRKVELKCPTENIPNQLVVDLENKDIGESFKISSIKLPEGVTPTIQGRDFVVATLAAPTVIKEPEKPAEETAEGAEATEGTEAAAEGTEGETKVAETDKKEPDKGDKKEGDKSKKENKKAPTEKK
jgi:large subunit ribosomal protein L25